jgi:hypothetical protein
MQVLFIWQISVPVGSRDVSLLFVRDTRRGLDCRPRANETHWTAAKKLRSLVLMMLLIECKCLVRACSGRASVFSGQMCANNGRRTFTDGTIRQETRCWMDAHDEHPIDNERPYPHHRPVEPESADIEKAVQYRDIRTELYGSGKIVLVGSDVTRRFRYFH